MNHRDKTGGLVEKIKENIYQSTEVLYIKDVNSVFVECSQGFEKILNVTRKDLIGRTDYDFAWKNYADEFRQNDKNTITKKNSITFEPVPVSKKIILASHCIKYPIYDETNEVIGVIGKADILSVSSDLQAAIQYLRILDKKNIGHNPIEKSYHITNYDKPRLTPRETECLFLTLRGKTAKEIGLFLNISFRAVEDHIENIKIKMNVSSKYELMDESIKRGLFQIIPKEPIFLSLFKNSSKWKDFLI